MQSRNRRLSFAASVELIDLDSGLQILANVRNISLSGCQVDKQKFPTGTRVRIRIVHRGAHFAALGQIANVQQDGSAGIRFLNVEQTHQEILDKWLAAIRN